MWADAAGASRGLGVVVYAFGKWWYTYAYTPQHIMVQLLERRDQQIGFQEMLAMVMGIAFPNGTNIISRW